MALKWKGRVRETTTTTGAGALTLGGAVTSYGTFASLMSTGDTCYGTVAHRTTTEWIDCLFTMEADGTLTRTTVIDGSSGVSTNVSFSSGTKDVFLGLPPAIVETLLGASLVTLGSVAYATSERTLTAGSGISLTDAGAGSTLTVANTAQGVTDHGALSGLTDDDHTQYVLLAPTTDARNVIQPTAATVKALVLKGAVSQSDNLLEAQDSSGTVRATINSSMQFSNTGGQANSEVFGAGAVVTNTGAVAIGTSASAGQNAVVIGSGSTGSGAGAVVIGQGISSSATAVTGIGSSITLSGGRGLALGNGQTVSATYGITLGAGSTASHVGAVCIGAGLTSTRAREFVIGSDTSNGAGASLIGQRVRVMACTSTNVVRDCGIIDFTWTDSTDASRTSKLAFSAYYTSSLQEILTLTAHASGVASSTAVFPGIVSITSSTGTNFTAGAFSVNQNAGDPLLTGAGNIALSGGTSAGLAHAGTTNIATYTGNRVAIRPGASLGWPTTNIYDALTTGITVSTAGTLKITNGSTGYGALACGTTDALTTTTSTVLTLGHNTSGTAAAGFGTSIVCQLESSTTSDQDAAKITTTWGVATDASREGILSLYATDYNGDRLGFQVTGDGTNTEIGFYGVTPVARPSAYTQTYSTADKTHAAPTAATLSMADGAGTNDNTIGAITADASVIAAFQELVDENNKLVADLADLKQLVNSMIDDLQSLGLLQ